MLKFSDKNTLTLVRIPFSSPNRQVKLLHGSPSKSIKTTQGVTAFFNHQSIIVLKVVSFNEFGSNGWDLYLFKGLTRKANAQSIPGVYPAVNLLLHAQGKCRVNKVLKLIESIEKRQSDLDNISEIYWVRQNARLWARMDLISPENEKNGMEII